MTFGKFVSIIMTMVLIVTILPSNVYAYDENVYVYTLRFSDLSSPTVLDELVDEFKIYVEGTDQIYEFMIISDDSLECRVPKSEEVTLSVRNSLGFELDKRTINSASLNLSYTVWLDVFWYMDGDDLVKKVLSYSSINILELNQFLKPDKLGYTFKEWVGENGKPFNFEYTIRYSPTTGAYSTHEYYVYATWGEHTHNWDVDNWNKDVDGHWHECIEDGCDIAVNEEKNGYGQHDFTGQENVIKMPTCSEDGLRYIYCKDGCGAYIEDTLEKENHIYGTQWEYDEEKHYHKCSKCGVHCEYEAAHEMGVWEIKVAPSFKEDGVSTRKCVECEYSEERIEHKLSESHVHNFSGREDVIQESSCTEEGLKYIYCAEELCGEYVEDIIDVIPHQYAVDWQYDEYTHYHLCEMCHIHKNEETEHQMQAGELVMKPTKEKNGVRESRCRICGYTEYEEVVFEEEDIQEDMKEPPKPQESQKPVAGPLETADVKPVHIYATVAMISGTAYMLFSFKDQIEEKAREVRNNAIIRLVKWAMSKSKIVRIIVATFIIVFCYRSMGKNAIDRFLKLKYN